jgi:hypothetical protein
MRALLDAMARGPVVTPARAALVVAAAALLAVGVVRGGRSSALSTPRRAVVTETPTRDPRCLGDVTLDFAALKPYWLDASGACGTVASVDGSLVLGQRGACGGARQSTVRLDSAHWAICGDFDVRVTFDLTRFPLPTVGSRYAVLHVVDPASPISGMAIERYAAGDGTTIPGESYKSWASDSNDGIATFVPSTDHAGSFRVTRVGAVVTSYYRVTEDGGAESWRRVLSETASSTPWIVELYSGYGERRGDPAAQAVTFSRLEVLSGSVR